LCGCFFSLFLPQLTLNNSSFFQSPPVTCTQNKKREARLESGELAAWLTFESATDEGRGKRSGETGTRCEKTDAGALVGGGCRSREKSLSKSRAREGGLGGGGEGKGGLGFGEGKEGGKPPGGRRGWGHRGEKEQKNEEEKAGGKQTKGHRAAGKNPEGAKPKRERMKTEPRAAGGPGDTERAPESTTGYSLEGRVSKLNGTETGQVRSVFSQKINPTPTKLSGRSKIQMGGGGKGGPYGSWGKKLTKMQGERIR